MATQESTEVRGHERSTWLVRDSGHLGTLLTWLEDSSEWLAVTLDGAPEVSRHDELAEVRLDCDPEQANEPDADCGLNQACVACDLEGDGYWLVDALCLDELREVYGERLTATPVEAP